MSRRDGFTLVELVVVVMILGILAAVAAPKLIDTSGTATDAGLKQTLSVIRDAIERYTAQNAGQLPGDAGTEADFLSDIDSYLRGPTFPNCPVGNPTDPDGVAVIDNTGTLAGVASPTPKGWKYNYESGGFIANFSGTDSDSVAYDQY